MKYLLNTKTLAPGYWQALKCQKKGITRALHATFFLKKVRGGLAPTKKENYTTKAVDNSEA